MKMFFNQEPGNESNPHKYKDKLNAIAATTETNFFINLIVIDTYFQFSSKKYVMPFPVSSPTQVKMLSSFIKKELKK